MPKNFKVADTARTASLLKKLVEASDVNMDGAVRWQEARWGVDRQKGVGISHKHPTAGQKRVSPAQTIESAVRFTQSKVSSEIPEIKKSIDEFAKRAKAADKNRDGVLSDNEVRRIVSGAAQAFVGFGREYSKAKFSDFILPTKHQGKLPSFSWKGSTATVCSSLLNAYSERKNDNFGGGEGPRRYRLNASEATKMVQALEPLYLARQKAVLTELASRTLKSFHGCVAVDDGARAVFRAYAAKLGVTGLQFKSPAAPPVPR